MALGLPPRPILYRRLLRPVRRWLLRPDADSIVCGPHARVLAAAGLLGGSDLAGGLGGSSWSSWSPRPASSSATSSTGSWTTTARASALSSLSSDVDDTVDVAGHANVAPLIVEGRGPEVQFPLLRCYRCRWSLSLSFFAGRHPAQTSKSRERASSSSSSRSTLLDFSLQSTDVSVVSKGSLHSIK